MTTPGYEGDAVAVDAASPNVVPEPPAGPGVRPPFPAPPAEGASRRLWFGLGIAGAAVLLCCGGGLAGMVGLVVTGGEAINERGRAVVRDYLDDVKAGRYQDAYKSLCGQRRDRESMAEFTDGVRKQHTIAGYDIHRVELGAAKVTVPVDVRYGDGSTTELRFVLEQEESTGALQVCEVE